VIRIGEQFEKLRRTDEGALIPFFTIGYPDVEKSLDLVRTAAKAGADVVEAGIPFSDPIADGPSIQYSSQEALKNGVTLRSALEALKGLPDETGVPLVVMTYYNTILSMGLRAFSLAARAVPVSGIIVPDLPPEEGGDLEGHLRSEDIDLIYLVAPTSTRERIEMIAGRTGGFLYAVSVTGVTGARRDLPPEIISFLEDLRRVTSKPVCVGFGVSTPDHARLLAPHADGIIVGSALVDLIRQNPRDPGTSVFTYLSEMKAAMRRDVRRPLAPRS
jgi:tryptophan synthase alpha chain